MVAKIDMGLRMKQRTLSFKMFYREGRRLRGTKFNPEAQNEAAAKQTPPFEAFEALTAKLLFVKQWWGSMGLLPECPAAR